MQTIHFRLDDLEKHLSKWSPPPVEISESKLFSLPDHLRRTYISVSSKGECDATEASNLTGRSRALESNYLNQLTRMGWLNKRKVSKTTIYYLAQEKPIIELATEKAENSKTAIGQFGASFKNYFNEPFDMHARLGANGCRK
ncbi:MAG: hypothetical protein ABSF44_14815 [Candidatus Bathyarchaeia archaeon]|jgi:hypothetical protein